MNNKVALITGASSGIGAATAKKFASHGMTVVLVARRYERLTKLATEIRNANGSAYVIPSDLSKDIDQQGIYERVMELTGAVDVLVNNAGIGWYGYYTNMPWEVAKDLLQVNVTAATRLTSFFLPQMCSRNQGHIINVGSIAGSFPNQGVALYSASKSFLDAFTTVIHRELRGTKVRCSVVRAGPVKTDFFNQAAKRISGLPLPELKFSVTPELVADRLWNLIQHPRKAIYVPRVLAIVPWIEMLFGGIIDRLGPILLKRTPSSR